MQTIHGLTREQRERLLEKVLKTFVLFCEQEFGYKLYKYQLRIGRACLSSLFVEPKDVCIKISRQAGKTETITLLVRFLLIFYKLFTGEHFKAAIASPKGEQAKTDLDRIKLSINNLKD